MLKTLLAVALITVAPFIQAQVRVVESTPRSLGSGGAPADMPVSVESDVYSQIRALQEEVAMLRGLVEEQAHELKQLKQLQLDNYMDLDRRLTGGGRPVVSQQVPGSAAGGLPPAIPSTVVEEPLSESEAYNAAYDLLNQKAFDSAVAAFNGYLATYPRGKFASNSHYWLGKVAMLKKDYPQSKTWFTELIANFPASPKVPDAQLDLGKVYFLMGDKVKAQALLSEVATGSTDTARLAQKFLADNF